MSQVQIKLLFTLLFKRFFFSRDILHTFYTFFNSYYNTLLSYFIYVSVYKKLCTYLVSHDLNIFNLLIQLYLDKLHFSFYLETLIFTFISKCFFTYSDNLNQINLLKQNLFFKYFRFVRFFSLIINKCRNVLFLKNNNLFFFFNSNNLINISYISFFYNIIISLYDYFFFMINYLLSYNSTLINNSFSYYNSFYSLCNKFYFYINRRHVQIASFFIMNNVIAFFDIYEFVNNFSDRSILFFNSNFFYVYFVWCYLQKTYKLMWYIMYTFFKLWSYFSNYFRLVLYEEALLFGNHKKEVLMFHLADD